MQQSERCVYQTKVSMVKWSRPQNQWVKINIDGSAITNRGQIWAAGILRDKEGRLVMAFTSPLGEGTNNKSEMAAAFFV